MRTPVSGIQHTLRCDQYEAVIASVGASLRALRHEGRDLVVPFEADELRPGYRGATLAPWPNRVVDGTYSFSGEEFELPLTEPTRGHALHGLAAWLDFQKTGGGLDRVTLAATIELQAGYPWRVEVTSTYQLSAEGLLQTGDKAEAKREALAALEIAPTYSRAQDILLKLTDGARD